MDKNICEKIIKEIKELPSGTVFTIKEFLDKRNIENNFELRYDYASAIRIGIKDIAEIHEEDKNAFLGPIFVFRFVKK